MSRLTSASMLAIFASLSLYAGVGTVPPTVVPEPSTMIVLGLGVAGAVLFARSRKSRN